jgi:hypothetical protein
MLRPTRTTRKPPNGVSPGLVFPCITSNRCGRVVQRAIADQDHLRLRWALDFLVFPVAGVDYAGPSAKQVGFPEHNVVVLGKFARRNPSD